MTSDSFFFLQLNSFEMEAILKGKNCSSSSKFFPIKAAFKLKFPHAGHCQTTSAPSHWGIGLKIEISAHARHPWTATAPKHLGIGLEIEISTHAGPRQTTTAPKQQGIGLKIEISSQGTIRQKLHQSTGEFA